MRRQDRELLDRMERAIADDTVLVVSEREHLGLRRITHADVLPSYLPSPSGGVRFRGGAVEGVSDVGDAEGPEAAAAVNAGELRFLLAHVPDDIPVILMNSMGPGNHLAARHVRQVKRMSGIAWHMASVQLTPGAVWREPESVVATEGPFRRRDEVAAFVVEMNDRISSET